MIYYIVPPIVIVVMLGALIFFISRKSDAIKKEIRKEEELALQGASGVIISKIHIFSLAFLEKMMLRVKLVFLKSYNQFDHWVHSVRDKKERKQERIENIEEAREEAEAKEARESEEREMREEVLRSKMVRKVEAVRTDLEKPAEASQEIKIPEKLRRMKVVKTDEIKAVPMVSQRVVQPEIKRKKKSHLEEALIERIALNPRDIEAYERLGDYYLEEKNNEDALECFRQVLKLSPGNHKAKLRLKKLEKNILGW